MPRFVPGLVGPLVSAQVGRRLGRPMVPAVAARLEAGPAQSAVFAPDRLLPRLPLEPGMRVLLLGPVPDSLIERVAQGVGKYGKVYVLQPSTEHVRRLESRRRPGRTLTVETLVGQPSHLDL